MNSTTVIPKCSSTIVCSPIDALPNSATNSEKGRLTANSTLSCGESGAE